MLTFFYVCIKNPWILVQKFWCSQDKKGLEIQTKLLIIKFESLNKFIVFSVSTLNFFFQISGPLLPIALRHHSMVRLGKGQAILGGRSTNSDYQAKIYSMGCSNRNCIITLLNRELSVPKYEFVAIPIPDTTSGCITGGKSYIRIHINFEPLPAVFLT